MHHTVVKLIEELEDDSNDEELINLGIPIHKEDKLFKAAILRCLSDISNNLFQIDLTLAWIREDIKNES